ncbi:MAG: 6-carboxytetrahydropterin synthase [Opitutaceae bacterium]|jgi:6-pyruvoyltetrahydropterin/6-carboxytetrahydropterin synthase
MPFKISKSFTVESGHILSKHPGACRFPHGHSRIVEIVLSADSLDERDMVCDFTALKHAALEFIMRFDHSMALNTADPQFGEYRKAYGDRVIPFEKTDPTSEVMAKAIYDHVKAAFDAAVQSPADPLFPVRRAVRVERVRITETASSWAEYGE